MYSFASASSDDVWNQLQQPRHGAALTPQYSQLLAALDQGWQIEEPVYLQPRLGERGPRIYLFILHQAGDPAPRLISLAEGPEARRVIEREQLTVEVRGMAQ